MGKQFTATAIMMLYEEGKVSLDESVSSYLPDAPGAWKNVTVKQLLSHTPGIPDYTDAPGWGQTVRLDGNRASFTVVTRFPSEK